MPGRKIVFLEPEGILKPWGLMSRRIRRITGCRFGVGEIWLASAQEGPGNVSNRLPLGDRWVTLASYLAGDSPEEGERRQRRVLGDKALEDMARTPYRGKTEAWYVRDVVGRVGIASGPRTQDDADFLRKEVRRGAILPQVENWSAEIRRALGVIEPVSAGDVFLVKPGTIHTMFAIGEDSHMIIDEIQQGYGDGLLPTLSKILLVENSVLSLQVHPSDREVAMNQRSQDPNVQDLSTNPTVRLYDFERDRTCDSDLAFSIARAGGGLTRPEPVSFVAPGGATVTALVVDPHFVKELVRIEPGAEYWPGPPMAVYRIVHCSEGRLHIETDHEALDIVQGQTVLLTADASSGSITAPGGGTIIQDFCPDVAVYVEYLAGQVRAPSKIDKLVNPSVPVCC